MGMNVNFGTGVNSYTQKLPGSATNSYSSAAANPFAQPAAYDSVSFSGKYDMEETEKKGMSTGAKVGLVAAAATVIVGAIAASRGKKLNTANGKTAKLWNNIKTGVASMFTKAGRESYGKLVADKTDDVVKAATEAAKKGDSKKVQQGATKFTKETMETVGADAQKAQKKIASLQQQIGKLDKTKDAAKIAQLEKEIAQNQKTINKFVNLTTSENLATDQAYTKIKQTKASAKEALDSATNKKNGLEKRKASLEKKKQAITNIGKKKRTAEQVKQLDNYQSEIDKIEKRIQDITQGTKDKNGKVLTKPLNELQTAYDSALQSSKQYKKAAQELSRAQITANNNTQLYKQILEKKNGTLTPTQDLIGKVDTLKSQASESNRELSKLKKAWEEFVKTGKYNEKIFGKI